MAERIEEKREAAAGASGPPSLSSGEDAGENEIQESASDDPAARSAKTSANRLNWRNSEVKLERYRRVEIQIAFCKIAMWLCFVAAVVFFLAGIVVFYRALRAPSRGGVEVLALENLETRFKMAEESEVPQLFTVRSLKEEIQEKTEQVEKMKKSGVYGETPLRWAGILDALQWGVLGFGFMLMGFWLGFLADMLRMAKYGAKELRLSRGLPTKFE